MSSILSVKSVSLRIRDDGNVEEVKEIRKTRGAKTI
jgi:hypothetical protein